MEDASDIITAFTHIAAELHTQYAIGFTPAEFDGRVHNLTLKVKQPGLAVRARRSYVANGDTLAVGSQISILSPKEAVEPIIAVAVSVGQDVTAYHYDISQERADALPRWDQRIASEPPLSSSQATQTAEAWLTSRIPDIKTFALSSLTLLRVIPKTPSGSCRQTSCWYGRRHGSLCLSGCFSSPPYVV